ncbi:hypothetical protein [Vibrio sp. Hal054]|uniref:hypothetical protein n=1 Tax=Vibrio sp. Hal054 TaxID=3035158 RepID=UPI00301E0490
MGNAKSTPAPVHVSAPKKIEPEPIDKRPTPVVPNKPVGNERQVDFINRKKTELEAQLSTIASERRCLEQISTANDLRGLYSVFAGFNKEESIECGQIMAGKNIPQLNDESDYIIYPAENPEREITFFSDYTCIHCRTDFPLIKRLNENGVTVRVYPYGRGEYRETAMGDDGQLHYTPEYTILGKNYVTASCYSSDMQTKRELFNELMNNSMAYTNDVLPQAASVDFNSQCALNVLGQKLWGDLFTTRGTPMYVFDNGSVNRGSLTFSEIMKKLN